MKLPLSCKDDLVIWSSLAVIIALCSVRCWFKPTTLTKSHYFAIFLNRFIAIEKICFEYYTKDYYYCYSLCLIILILYFFFFLEVSQRSFISTRECIAIQYSNLVGSSDFLIQKQPSCCLVLVFPLKLTRFKINAVFVKRAVRDRLYLLFSDIMNK